MITTGVDRGRRDTQQEKLRSQKNLPGDRSRRRKQGSAPDVLGGWPAGGPYAGRGRAEPQGSRSSHGETWPYAVSQREVITHTETLQGLPRLRLGKT